MTRPKTHAPQEPDPSDVGAQLKRRRTLRGQSLEAVHQQTRIPREHLEALESNNFDFFPAPVYLRGFLRSYCEYLDIDYDSLTESLNAESGDFSPVKKSPATPINRVNNPFSLSFSESTLLPFILIVGLAAAGVLLWALKGRPEAPAPSARQDAAAARRKIAESTLVLKALRTVTLTLESSGEIVFEGRLHEGQSPSFTGRNFVLRTANPQDIQVLLNQSERPWSELPPSSDGAYPITPGAS